MFYGLPRAGILIDPFPAAVLVFSLNEGAYSAETMRAALEAVPGRPARSRLLCRHVVSADHAENYPSAGDAHRFPAAFQLSDRHGKGYFPCRKYHVTEMFMVTQRIVARTHEPLALYIEVGLIYLLFSTVLTKLQGIGEKKLSTYQKKGE